MEPHLSPLPTTVIGAFPKPDYVPVSDWFDLSDFDYAARWSDEMAAAGEDAEALFTRAAAEVIADQVDAGVDVVTDGEVRRENYVHYHCRHLTGFDFEHRAEETMRGVLSAVLPVIVGPVAAKGSFLPHDWRVAQASTDHPVKVTIPGPLTITDTVVDRHYGDRAALVADLAVAINIEVRALAEAGCTHIQVDEPVFARRVDDALSFGIDALAACFDGAPDTVTRTVHCCCGYPRHLDDDDYEKAPPSAYLEIAEAVDAAQIDRFSIEDAHRPNDLAHLPPLPVHDGDPRLRGYRPQPGRNRRRGRRPPGRGTASYRPGAPGGSPRLRPRLPGPRPGTHKAPGADRGRRRGLRKAPIPRRRCARRRR
tara:strand:- start:7999 stop:9099 length:1101 start_codon:yes stop_codon:yes gene_type:complete